MTIKLETDTLYLNYAYKILSCMTSKKIIYTFVKFDKTAILQASGETKIHNIYELLQKIDRQPLYFF
jgi:hypothetical protein